MTIDAGNNFWHLKILEIGVSASFDKKVIMWDINNFREVKSFYAESQIANIDITLMGKYIAIKLITGKILIFESR